MDLAKIGRESIANVETKIGRIFLFSISLNDQNTIRKNLSVELRDCAPKEYMKELFKYMCYLEEQLEEGKYKPKNSLQSDIDIESLDDFELEEIASKYVTAHPYFSRTKITDEDNEIEPPRTNDESWVDYLHRLSVREDEKWKELGNQRFESLTKIGGFSSGLAEQLKNTYSLGESLRSSMESIRNTERPFAHEKLHTQIMDHGKLFREQEKSRLQPFNELGNRLDALRNVSAQSVDLMIKTNEIQTQIVKEIKDSGDAASTQAKRNIKLTYIVILLTLFGTASAIFSIWWSISAPNDSQVKMEEATTKGLNILQSIDTHNQKQTELNTLVDEKIQSQNLLIEELKQRNDAQAKTIHDLQSKVNKIDSQK